MIGPQDQDPDPISRINPSDRTDPLINLISIKADFYVQPGEMFTNTYTINRKGAWTLFVEFPGNR